MDAELRRVPASEAAGVHRTVGRRPHDLVERLGSPATDVRQRLRSAATAAYPRRMGFRDDREALRAGREAAEADARELRERLAEVEAQLSAHETKDVKDEAELARLRDQVARLRGQPARPRAQAQKTRLVIAGIVAAVFVMGSVIATFFMSTKRPARVQAPPAPAAATAPAPKPPPSRLDVAIVGAQVTVDDELGSVAPGDGCAIEAEVRGSSLGQVRVYCGGAEPVYDSTMTGGAEMRMSSSNAAERAVPGGFDHLIAYGDTGNRTGPRPQISLDSEQHTARIWRDDAMPFDLRLFLDDRSAIHPGAAVGGVTDIPVTPMHLGALATHHTGNVPGDLNGCELIAHGEAAGDPHNCRFVLRCGDTILYGASHSGYNACALSDENAILSADDDHTDDGDPAFHLNTAEHTLSVAGEDWQVELRLEPDSRCNLDGRWSGRARTPEAESTLHFGPGDGDATVFESDALLSGPAQVQLDCQRGTAQILLEDGTRYDGRFGPGFATFLGRRGGETPALFWMRRER